MAAVVLGRNSLALYWGSDVVGLDIVALVRAVADEGQYRPFRAGKKALLVVGKLADES